MYDKLNSKVILHCKGVAEVMYTLAKENKDEMYALGILHDIGKLHGFKNHGEAGARITSDIGVKYHKEILYHGKVQNDYKSNELNLLNAADLSVDAEGNIIGYKKRIEDIGVRYGFDSNEYRDAMELSKSLLDLLEEIEIDSNRL